MGFLCCQICVVTSDGLKKKGSGFIKNLVRIAAVREVEWGAAVYELITLFDSFDQAWAGERGGGGLGWGRAGVISIAATPRTISLPLVVCCTAVWRNAASCGTAQYGEEETHHSVLWQLNSVVCGSWILCGAVWCGARGKEELANELRATWISDSEG